MKGDMDDGLWNLIRDPDAFLNTVRGLGPTFKDLQAHIFEKAESALEQLAKLVWNPILQKYQALQGYFNSDAPRSKPASSWVYSFCISIA